MSICQRVQIHKLIRYMSVHWHPLEFAQVRPLFHGPDSSKTLKNMFPRDRANRSQNGPAKGNMFSDICPYLRALVASVIT